MKKQKKSWSYGVWSRSLGLKATSSLTKILNGEREPGPEITEKMIRYFGFKEKQAQYFRDLVQLEKIKTNPRLSVLFMEKMDKEHPDSRIRILDNKSFLVISNWYYLALREFCRLQNFKEDPEWISQNFLFKITAREVNQAIKTLLEMKLLTRDKKNILRLSEGILDTSNDIASEGIKRYHEQMLENAKSALAQISVDEREITSTTLLMSSGNIAKAKDLIRDFKKKFEKLMEEETGDQVFQFQMQLFPLTQKQPRGSE
jgi:uncharacterized protein (TIGR02147 family)